MEQVEREHGVVARDDLLAAGLSPRELARWAEDGRLVSMARGVYRVGGAPPTFEAEVLAAIKVHPGDSWASHHTASRLASLGLYGPDPRIELTRPDDLSAQRTAARVHRSTLLPAHHLTTRRGIPMTTPARTLFDLARTTGPVRLRRATTVALRDGKCTITGLYRVLYDLGGRGRPGTRRMRTVLDEKGHDYIPTESELDELGRALLAGIGIEWQVELSDRRGYIRRVDGLHRPSGLVIEFDGAAFHDPPEQAALDEDGDARLRAGGHRVERLRWGQVTREGDATRAKVLRLIRSAAA